jgi:lipopolysaccharide export system protein LptA
MAEINHINIQAACRRAGIIAGCVLFIIACFPGICSLSAQPADNRKTVEFIHADSILSMTYNGKTINRFVGRVQFMHNGARMSSDSVYLFSSSEFEAYSRVVVIKDGTTLYGDRLHYDGAVNMAKVRGTLVRLTDSTATLRTQHLDFDTKQNIGHFFNGGTIVNKNNLLESVQGHYHADEKLFVFSDSVSMRNETYDILCESGKYNTETDVATFTGATSIWHKDGFLSCRYGWYDKPRDYFYFSENAYLQSEKQEVWADSIFYDRKAGKGELYGNVQMHDTTQSLIVFGDEAHFTETPENVIVTRKPSLAYYTMENNQPDTAFVRADTLHFITEPNPAYRTQDTVTVQNAAEPATDTLAPAIVETPPPVADTLAAVDTTLSISDTLAFAAMDTTLTIPDTLALAAMDTTALVAPAPAPDSIIRKLFAYHHVRMFRSNLQAACDSFAYSSLDSLGRMFVRPVLWNEEQQISANEIHFLTDQKKILRADFLQAAFIITHEQDTFYNQVKGRDIIARFRDNEIYLADVLGGAQTVYYLQEDCLVENSNIS